MKVIIEKEELNQSQMAERLNCSRSYISELLIGRYYPSYQFLIKIKRAFPNITNDFLLNENVNDY